MNYINKKPYKIEKIVFVHQIFIYILGSQHFLPIFLANHISIQQPPNLIRNSVNLWFDVSTALAILQFLWRIVTYLVCDD